MVKLENSGSSSRDVDVGIYRLYSEILNKYMDISHSVDPKKLIDETKVFCMNLNRFIYLGKIAFVL